MEASTMPQVIHERLFSSKHGFIQIEFMDFKRIIK